MKHISSMYDVVFDDETRTFCIGDTEWRRSLHGICDMAKKRFGLDWLTEGCKTVHDVICGLTQHVDCCDRIHQSGEIEDAETVIQWLEELVEWQAKEYAGLRLLKIQMSLELSVERLAKSREKLERMMQA